MMTCSLWRLEALEYTYGSALLISGDPLRITLHATPFTGEESSKQFVCADLELRLAAEYPEAPSHHCSAQCQGCGLLLACSAGQ